MTKTYTRPFTTTNGKELEIRVELFKQTDRSPTGYSKHYLTARTKEGNTVKQHQFETCNMNSYGQAENKISEAVKDFIKTVNTEVVYSKPTYDDLMYGLGFKPTI